MTAIVVRIDGAPVRLSAAESVAGPRVAELPPFERRMLRVLRLLAESDGDRQAVGQELWLSFGFATVEPALQAAESLLTTIAVFGRRALRMKTPVARRLGAGEGCVLALLAAANMRDEARAVAHARWLVRGNAQRRLIREAEALVRAVR